MNSRVRKVVLPVAGLGTRFLPATKAVPKELLPVVDRPLVQYAIDEAVAAGIEEIIFVTGRGKSAIEDYFDVAYELETELKSRAKKDELAHLEGSRLLPGNIAFTRQQAPHGLGHAVWCARHFIGDEPFAVMLPDDLVKATPGCLAQLLEIHEKTQGNVVAVERVPKEQTNLYGILDIGERDGAAVEVKGLVEKPDPKDAPSTLCIIGRYILLPEIFAHLDQHERGAGNEIQLTDAMAKMIGGHPMHGVEFDGVRYDCGTKIGFLEANVAYALDRPDLAGPFAEILSKYTGGA
jgi:UTP--glucose-1-phosphate uridylyltransferase